MEVSRHGNESSIEERAFIYKVYYGKKVKSYGKARQFWQVANFNTYNIIVKFTQS